MLRSLYLWGIGLLYITPVLVILYIRSFVQVPEAYDAWLKRHLLRLFRLLKSPIHIEYQEELPLNTPLIFMANHSSLIDVPLLKAVIPRHFRGILAVHQFSYPLYGQVIRRMKHIAIDRDNVRQSLRSFAKARELLEQGISIVVLPEGSRSLDGKLRSLKKLPFHFAKDSGVAIVPVGISGVYEMKNKNSWQLHPSEITVRFGSIITQKTVGELRIDELRNHTERALQSLIETTG